MLPPRQNPQLFGHQPALDAFARAAGSGRLPHAWLLSGPQGIGKATLAYRLARQVLAGTAAAAHSTEQAPSALFRRVAHGSEPDLFVLERTPNPRSGRMRNEITVDQVREVTAGLQETAVGKEGGRAVVVDAADELNSEAANAFLKLLEEPPRGVVLFLVCQAPGRIPRTVLSRCVRLTLAPLDDQAMRRALEAAGVTGTVEPALLDLARGSPGRYHKLQASGYLNHYAALLAGLLSGREDRRELVQSAERLATLGDSAGSELVADLLRTIVQRGAAQLAGSELGPALAADEMAMLQRLTDGQPLDRWLALWDKLQRLPFDLDQLNVDPRQALYLVLAAMAGGHRDA